MDMRIKRPQVEPDGGMVIVTMMGIFACILLAIAAAVIASALH